MTTKEASKKFGLTPENEFDRMMRELGQLLDNKNCTVRLLPNLETFDTPKFLHTYYMLPIKMPECIITDYIAIATMP